MQLDRPPRSVRNARARISVIVTGYDSHDSYAYPAGLDQVVINPQ